jgi:hypothetical protein
MVLRIFFIFLYFNEKTPGIQAGWRLGNGVYLLKSGPDLTFMLAV